jgi:hypothetical protein
MGQPRQWLPQDRIWEFVDLIGWLMVFNDNLVVFQLYVYRGVNLFYI